MEASGLVLAFISDELLISRCIVRLTLSYGFIRPGHTFIAESIKAKGMPATADKQRSRIIERARLYESGKIGEKIFLCRSS